MDIRGIEITNQLRSAIRAKLLELGVRYDEELPDYILVMVVNKKSRQQMKEDLHLFLEDSTESFVNWLHDQVLKKLQKVTVTKKKNNKEISSIVVKEEDRKKCKVEDQSNHTLNLGSEDIVKNDRDREFEELVGDLVLLNEEDSKADVKELQINDENLQKKRNLAHAIDFENNACSSNKKPPTIPNITTYKPNLEKKLESPSTSTEIIVSSEKCKDTSSQNLKRSSNINENILNEKSVQCVKRSKISKDSDSESDNKNKLDTNRPRITSVVSVKTKFGIISPSKKIEIQCKGNNNTRNLFKQNQLEVISDTNNQRTSFNQSKNIERRKQRNDNLRIQKKRDDKSPNNKRSDKSVCTNKRNNKSKPLGDLRNRGKLSTRLGTIKSRLGTSSNHSQDKLSLKSSNSTKVSKPKISNVKSRLGVRSNQQSRGLISALSRLSHIDQSDTNFEDDDSESLINATLKSHIIAVKKLQHSKQKRMQTSKKEQISLIKDTTEEESKNEEDEDQSKVPSKIIVTPRPLKPLQPSQKRATQSLLLRAVAEANQSVVMQKKIDPCLKEQKSVNKIKITRDPWEGKILSINLNSKKRLVMEKIQVELANRDKINKAKAQIINEKHLDVVKSLFKRSDDKQKFLVTLSGYNNNILKERNSDDEERLEMEVNEDDELTLTNNQYESYIENNQIISPDNDDVNEEYTDISCTEVKIENSENDNVENLRENQDSSFKKRRKLSPIIYTRSRSNSPSSKPLLASTVNSVLCNDKRPLISSVITTVGDKSNEKCRYWPNCTLGIKCAFYHPEVICSSFPACKFGDKCAYKHPKCKFGSACTKLGCIFSHPPVQCKYHPYCMKPGCPFSHPKALVSSSLTSLTPDLRAKFTWKKKE